MCSSERLHSKQILRILIAQWNRGLVAVLKVSDFGPYSKDEFDSMDIIFNLITVMNILLFRQQTKKRGNEMLRRWVMQ
jgi:hypothetical protein